jgi:GNAT superfamily N-acetyltransferase
MLIRDARPGDADHVAALLDDLGYPASPAQAAARLERLMADPASRVLVAEVDGAVVGLVATHLVPRLDDDRPSCRVLAMVTARRHRRAGIATALMAAAERDAQARGACRLGLSSGDWRPDAHALYERLGFESNGRSFVKPLP